MRGLLGRAIAERKLVRKAPGSTIRTLTLKGAVSRARDSERPVEVESESVLGTWNFLKCDLRGHTFESEFAGCVEAAGW